MKIVVNVKDMNGALKKLGPVIKSNPVIPVLENVQLKLIGDKLRMVGTDINNVVGHSFPVKSEGVDEGFEFLLPFKMAKDFFSLVVDETVVLDVSNVEKEVVITSKKGKYKIASEDPKEFPIKSLDDILQKEGEGIKVNTKVFRESIKMAIPFIDVDNMGRFDCLDITIKDNKISFLALSGHRIIHKEVDTNISDNVSIRINRESSLTLLGVLSEIKDDELTLIVEGEEKVHFIGSEDLVSATFTETRLPLESAFNFLKEKESMVVVRIDRMDFEGTVKLVSPYYNSTTKKVVLKFNNDTMVAKSQDIDFGKEAEIRQNLIEGNEVSVGFNISYMRDCLSVLKEDEVVMQIPKGEGDWCREAVLIEEKTNGLKMIILPLIPDAIDLAKAS